MSESHSESSNSKSDYDVHDSSENDKLPAQILKSKESSNEENSGDQSSSHQSDKSVEKEEIPESEKKDKKKNDKKANSKKRKSSQDLNNEKNSQNKEEIPKLTTTPANDEKNDETTSKSNEENNIDDLPFKKRKSAVTFQFPVAPSESVDSVQSIQMRERSKSDHELYVTKNQNSNDHDHDEASEPLSPVKKAEFAKHLRASSNPGKPRIDPRDIPRRFSKMTIEQIDEVINTEDRLLDAISFFNKNKDPSKLCQYYEVEETPANIAQIFWGTKDINSGTLGKYLLKQKEMLDAYFMEVDMDKGPIQSLRNALLGPMRFDGESQIVHKVLSSISRCYAQKNPDKCDDPDNMLDLYYALIMLNTDLSNPNNKYKMTLQEFIKNTKGANEYLSTLSDEELTGYYKNIQKHPLLFQNQPDDFTYEFCPKIRGYMKKKSMHTFGTWTKKYFVLINSCLYYFSDDNPENAKYPIGAVYLKGVEPFRNRDTTPLLIRITAKKKDLKYAKFINKQKDNPKYVKGIKEILLEAPDRASSSKWFHRIRVAAQVSNFMKEKKEEIIEKTNVYEADIPDAAEDDESGEECDQ